jgi:hypothetical protein
VNLPQNLQAGAVPAKPRQNRVWRNDIEALGTLFSNHIADYRNLINSYMTLKAGS